MDLLPTSMLTSASPMPAAAPAVMPAAASDFAALLTPLTQTAPESTPQDVTPAASQQDSDTSYGSDARAASGRSLGKANDRSATRRQNSASNSNSSQSAANAAVPTPAPQQEPATRAPAKHDSQNGTSGTEAKVTAQTGPAASTPGDAASSNPAGPQTEVDGASASSADVSTKLTDAVLPATAAANTLPPNPFAADIAALDAGKQAAAKSAVEPQGAQPQKATTKTSPEPTPAANNILPPNTPGATDVNANQNHQDVAAAAVKAAVNQATLQSSKEIGIKATHSVESKSSGAALQASDPHAAKNSGNENSSNNSAHDFASGQNQTKKAGESDSAKGTEFTAHFDNGQTNPPAHHDATDVAGRTSPDPVSALPATKDAAASSDLPQAPANSHGAALPGTDDSLPAGSLVHSTALLEQLGHSELKVGMRMGDLGSVEIRTQMHDQQLKAEISVEHRDLGRILTNELPALQQRLQQSNVSLASVMVRDNGAGSAGGGFQGEARSQQFGFAPQTMGISSEHTSAILSSEEIREGTSALDIHI